MSDFMIKSKIDKLVRESGLLKHPSMICSIVKIFQMRYPKVPSDTVCKMANKSLR